MSKRAVCTLDGETLDYDESAEMWPFWEAHQHPEAQEPDGDRQWVAFAETPLALEQES